MRIVYFVTLCTGLSSAWPLAAQDLGETSFGGGISIFGPVLEGAYRYDPDYRLRGVIIGGWEFDQTGSEDDGNTYDLDADVTAAAILVDHFPTGDGWRFSGGLFFNMSELEAVGRGAGGAFEVNGETFDQGIVEATARFSRGVAPIVTVGYEHLISDDMTLNGEFGAIYTGGLETTLEANSDLLQDAIDDDPDFQDPIYDADNIALLPYISVALSFRF